MGLRRAIDVLHDTVKAYEMIGKENKENFLRWANETLPTLIEEQQKLGRVAVVTRSFPELNRMEYGDKMECLKFIKDYGYKVEEGNDSLTIRWR